VGLQKAVQMPGAPSYAALPRRLWLY
jgi:hypothetical protein